MNIVLLDPRQTESELWSISAKRQLEHLHRHLQLKVGDTLKVGIQNGKRYLTQVVDVSETAVRIKPLHEESVPAKLPVTLIVAMPRPKVCCTAIGSIKVIGKPHFYNSWINM